jgi:hypothetical protein
MRRFAIMVLWCCVGSSAMSFDVQRWPTPQDTQTMQAMGWGAAAEELEKVLAEQWKPTHYAQAGSAGNQVFRQWLHLARWARLLGTTEQDAFRSWLALRINRPVRDEPWTVVGPGLPRPDGTGVSPEELPLQMNKISEIATILLSQDFVMQDGDSGNRLSPAMALELANDAGFLEEFFCELSSEDYAPAVLMRLQETRAQFPFAWPSYRSLMLALALVYDQQIPSHWPHHQVPSSAVPRSPAGFGELFGYFYRLNESRRSEHDLRRMGVKELRFLVDAPVQISELEWAEKNVRSGKTQFEKVFEKVAYDHERGRTEQYVWPDAGDYRLATILDRGGICTDQAYFASIAGKAKGIPTLYFAGQGKDGGHAWFGYLRGGGRWELDAGRYFNQNYTVGMALDPQTWLPITDHELLYLGQSSSPSPAVELARVELAMTRIFLRRGDMALADSASRSAWQNATGYLPAWEMRERVLIKSGQTDELRAFYEQAANNFRRHEDLRVRYQTKWAELARAGGEEVSAREMEERVVRQNRRSRQDLSSAAGGEVLQRLLAQRDFASAKREYGNLLRRLGETGGGNFFFEVVHPYVLQLRAAGRTKDAEQALREARRSMPVEKGTILAKAFAELESQP